MKNLLGKTIEYGLYLLIFLLPWQTRWIFKSGAINEGYSEYLSYSLYGSDILLAILLALYIFYNRKKVPAAENRMKMVWIAVGLFELISFISVFTASDHLISLYKYLNLLFGIGLFFLIVNFPYDRSKMMFFLLSSTFIQSAIGIYQFLSQESPVSKWLGMAPHVSSEGGVAVVEAMGNLGFVERWLRAYGSLPHPNILGGFLALGIMLAVLYSINIRRKNHYNDDLAQYARVFKMNLFCLLMILWSIIALFFSFSRSAWLSLIAFFVLFMFISVMKKDILSQRYFLPIILYIGIALFIISIPFYNLIEARVESKGRIEIISQTERASSTNMAINMSKENLLIGVGIGNYVKELSEAMPNQESYHYQPAHNTFLLIFSELGVLGFSSFLFLLFAIFLWNANPNDMLLKLPLFIAVVILLYFDHWLWSLHFGVYYFWMFLGFVWRYFTLDANEPDVV